MADLKIIEVSNENELLQFFKFPMKLYKNNKNYVPPLIKDEIEIWNPKENPAFQYSEAKQFLAYRGDTVVGRIAVMVNHKEAEELGIRKVRFGWLDFIDDIAVSRALMKVAEDYATEKNIFKINILLPKNPLTNIDFKIQKYYIINIETIKLNKEMVMFANKYNL